MTSQSRALRVLIVTAVALAAIGAFAGGAAAATDTLAGDGTDEIQDFNASSDDYVEYTLNSDAVNFSEDGTTSVHLNMTVNDEHVTVSNSTISGSASSYTFNLSQDELGTIPGNAGENTTITVNAWGEDSAGNTSTTTDTFDATLLFHDGYAVIYVGDAASAGDVTDVSMTAEEPEGWLSAFQDSTYTVEADAVGLGQNASGTTIHVVAANQSDSDAFSEADGQAIWGSYSEGDFHKGHRLLVEGHKHAVFHTEVADFVVDDYTYATVSERNGHDTYSVHVGDDYDGESSMDIETVANDKYGPVEATFIKSAAENGFLANNFAASTSTGGVGLVA